MHPSEEPFTTILTKCFCRFISAPFITRTASTVGVVISTPQKKTYIWKIEQLETTTSISNSFIAWTVTKISTHSARSVFLTTYWKYSSPPNHLGKILMWWKVGISVVFVVPNAWCLTAGAVANTGLFSRQYPNGR